MHPSDEADVTRQGEALLALNRNKSPNALGCPNPRLDRAFVLDSGEVVPIPCSRNSCPHCRRRNVQETAAKMGLNQTLTDRPVTHAVLSTTRDWVDAETLKEGWRQVSRNTRKHVCPDARYAWFREWSVKPIDGTDLRRTHYHSTWALDDDEQAQAVKEISLDVWSKLSGAWSEDAHGWKKIFDAGGLTRYIAGLVGHHLKQSQQPNAEWRGRRFGTSRGFYAIDSRELDKQAKSAVRDERLAYHLEQTMACDDGIPDGLPESIWDELLTQRLDAVRDRPPPRIVRLDRGFVW